MPLLYIRRKNFEPTLSLKKFRLNIVDKLVAQNLPVSKGRKRKVEVVGPHKPQISIEKRRSESAHLPFYDPEGHYKRCALCNTKKDERRTQSSCSVCKVNLCLPPKRNCFADFHK